MDLQTQIQGLSRTMSVFKDFPGLENLEKIREFQGPATALMHIHSYLENSLIIKQT